MHDLIPQQIYVANEPGAMPFCTVFNHFPKTGGSSIVQELKKGASMDDRSAPGIMINVVIGMTRPPVVW